jgi:phage tail-like protein
MRRDDWLLQQLPVGMVEDDFFHRFVSIFQEVANTVVDGVDNIDNVADVTVTPEAMLRWMASWIGVQGLDPTLPHELQRRIVRTAAKTLVWRGTRRGLTQFLELISGAPVSVEDGGGVFAEGAAPAEVGWVRIHVVSTGWLTEADFLELVRDEVPAHAVLEVYVGGRRIWPTAVLSLDVTGGFAPLAMTSGEVTP